MAALLACAPGAVLSHSAAIEFWRVGPRRVALELTICPPRRIRHPRLKIHRSLTLTASEIITVGPIRVTDPLRTLVDMARRRRNGELDDAVERMSQSSLRSPNELLSALERRKSIPGSAIVREALTRWTTSLTETQLERRFIPIAKRAGLPAPLTQQRVNGYRVDFYWPELRLVVEADSLRYHRTAARQTEDLKRDQAHLAAGLTPARFSHAQITHAPDEVETRLRRIASTRAAST
jgi:very-short-patch-repair endonuclease